MLIELILFSGAIGFWSAHRQHQQQSTQPVEEGAKKSLGSVLSQINIERFFQDAKSVLDGRERESQLIPDLELRQQMQKAQSGVNRDLLISVGTISTAILAAHFPLLALFSVAGILYSARHVFRLIWRDFKAKNFFSTFLISAILVVGMIATGHLVLAALSSLLGGFLAKIIERTEHHSREKLTHLFNHQPSKMWLERNGIEIEVDFTQLQVGDIVVVNAGEVIPVDGMVEVGTVSVDQHLLTGESQPVEKGPGDQVFAATLLLSGKVKIRVNTAGEDTVAAQIGQVLNQTQTYKEQLITRGKKIADTFLPVELGISTVTWLLLGPGAALTVLWAALGTNMIALGPMSVLNYLQILSRRGILIKDGRVLESLQQVDTVIFDKTGTLTVEQPTLVHLHCFENWDENTLLTYAAAAEYRQSHPLAKSIVEQAALRELVIPKLDEACYEIGYGIKVLIDDQLIRVGSARFLSQEGIELPERVHSIQKQAEDRGCSLVYLAIEEKLAGILEMQPTIRPETVDMVNYLKKRGMTVYIISGDHEQATAHTAESVGIDRYFAEVLPKDKANLVTQLREEGRFVCFIGDGINDAIALKTAQVSISLKGASTVATDTAQVILMDGTLNHLLELFELTDEFEETMRVNLLSSFVPGIVCIGGVYFLHFGMAVGMGIYYAGSVIGLSNTLLPLIKYQDPIPDSDSSGQVRYGAKKHA